MEEIKVKQRSGKLSFSFFIVFSTLFAVALMFASRLSSELLLNGNRFLYLMIASGASVGLFLLSFICGISYRKAGENKFNQSVSKWKVFIAFVILTASFFALYFCYGFIEKLFDSTNTNEYTNITMFSFVFAASLFIVFMNIISLRKVKPKEPHIPVLSLKYEPYEKALKEKKPFGFAKVVNALTPYVLCIYALMVFIPWVCKPYDGLYNILNGESFSLIYRLIEAGVFVVWMLLIMIFNKKAPELNKWLLFALIGGMLAFVAFTSDVKFAHESMEVVLTKKDIVVHYANIYFALFFAFSAMFIIPIAKCNVHSKNMILWLFLLIGVASIAFSFYKEFDMYKETLTHFSSKYSDEVTSFYKSKNVYGVIVMISFVSSTVLAFQKKRVLRVILLVYTFLAVILTGIIFCTTAFLSGIALIAFMIIWFFVKYVRRHPITLSIIYSLVISAIIVVVLFITIPELYELNSVLTEFNKMLFRTKFADRITIWERLFENLGGKKNFAGNGLITLYYFPLIRDNVVQLKALHNGYLNLFAFGGVVYLSFYIYIVSDSFRNIHRFKKFGKKPMALAIASIVAAMMVYSFAESNVIGLDSSIIALLPSLVVLTFPKWYMPEFKKEWLSQDI